jgi:hypothetical protein
MWGAVGAAAAVAGAAIPSGGSHGGGGGGGAPQVGGSDSAYKPAPSGQTTAPTIAVPHLAAGGLIMRPTLAMIGDAGREAVIPLGDRSAMRELAEAVMQAGGSGGGGIVVNVKGMISPDNLRQVVRKISRDVVKGNVRLNTTNSFRITKRS